jgi:hypothetical protein
MKTRIDGNFVFALCLGAFIVVCLIAATDYPASLQVAIYLAGYTTLALIILLLAGTFRPEILRWSETTLQDLWGGDSEGDSEGAAETMSEGDLPWSAVLKSMGYAVGFLLLAFFAGLFVAPPIFLATYLIVEAKMHPLPAVLAGLITTALLDTGMIMVHVDVWPGIIPEIFEGYLGGAILPPV